NFNSDTQVVISGTKEAVSKAMELAHQAGALKVVPLNVSGAFHSPLMKQAVEKMKPIVAQTEFSDSDIPVLTNVDAQATSEAEDFKRKLIDQIDHSVLWHDIDIG